MLGINSYTHDASISLISKKEPIYLIEEERITRNKHHDGIIFGGSPPDHCLKNLIKYGIPKLFCHSKKVNHAAKTNNFNQLKFINFAKSIDPNLENTLFFDHHSCHAASAFFTSPFEESYICTLDSSGDGLSCTISEAKGNILNRIYTIPAVNSICHIYSYATELLGLGKRSEGSLMALAALGNNHKLLSNLFFWNGLSISIKNVSILENAVKKRKDLSYYADIALSIQSCFESAVISMLEDVCRNKAIKNICLAGGGFLNCRLNKKIADSGRWENVYIPPVAGDSGTALGAALLGLSEPRKFKLEHSFWGDEYSGKYITNIIKNYNLKAIKIDISKVVELLAQKKIGAIFDSRMEFGPRALGHRSLIADPRYIECKQKLNRIKFREYWRPVAPSVLHFEGTRWFENYKFSPFMTRAFDVKSSQLDKIPAVLHNDNTARIQSVTQHTGIISQILNQFYELTGIPILCNTSFNVREPIVRTPEDAIRTFYTSPIDFLCLGKWLFLK